MKTIPREDFLDLLKYNKELGISMDKIIENAACKIINNIDLSRRDTFAIICGTKDNGAYGLTVARLLKSERKYVEVYIVDTDKEQSDEFKNQFEIIKRIDIKINYLQTIGELEDFSKNLCRVNTLIDAITGIEYNSIFQGVTEYVINTINKSRIYTISIDIPSGMDYDTGDIKIACVMSDLVITFYKSKIGIEKNIGLHKFDVKVVNIGLIERG